MAGGQLACQMLVGDTGGAEVAAHVIVRASGTERCDVVLCCNARVALCIAQECLPFVEFLEAVGKHSNSKTCPRHLRNAAPSLLMQLDLGFVSWIAAHGGRMNDGDPLEQNAILARLKGSQGSGFKRWGHDAIRSLTVGVVRSK
eukprot:3885269-Pyramimonas_sp.AAC.1